MSNKTLLNEAQVRKFMKLASLEPLAPGFIHGLTERSTDEMEESHGSGKLELNQTDDGLGRHTNRAGQLSEEEGLEDMAADAEEDASDMEQDVEDLDAVAVADEVAADDGRMIAVDDFLAALETALESALGDEVEIDASEMDDDSEHDEHEEENAEHDMEHAADLEDDAEEDMGDIMETGAKRDGESKGDKGKDKDDPSARDYEHGGDRKGDESKTHKGEKDYTTKKGDELKDDEPGGRGEKKGDKAYVNEATDDLVEAVTKRVAARILKSALAKK